MGSAPVDRQLPLIQACSGDAGRMGDVMPTDLTDVTQVELLWIEKRIENPYGQKLKS
jgi:hypothetical protein